MKTYFYILVLLLTIRTSAFSNELLDKAEKAYDSKKYKEAIESYERLVTEGYKSYQLYYNLGNSYYRNNQIGKAIYNYELARKMEPNDEDIRINLSKAATKTTDKIESKENFFIAAVKTNVLSTFTTQSWAWFSIIGLSLTSILTFIFVNGHSPIIKRVVFLFACCFLLVFVFSYSLGYSALKSKYDNKFAIILSHEVKIMNEPTVSASSKFTLHEGTKIRVVENNGDWVLIKLDNGNEGWVHLNDVGII